MKIAIVGIDNRPICYDIIYDILSIDKNIEVFMPEIETLGSLENGADIDRIFDFIKNLKKIDYFIICLDTIAYGGLISSRRCDDSFCEIKERIEKFKNLLKEKNAKILAFSSIMRISNNNINEEEKPYWAQWGKRIFDWSYYLHKSEVQKCENCVINKVPGEILEDYLKTRKRNFEINKIYLNWAKEGFFDTLIFSKDDCAQYGLNVKEAQILEKIIKEENINNAKIKTGADEIPLTLIARALNNKKKIKIKPVFLNPESKNLISKYEDISIYDCVQAQIELANCVSDENNPDLTLLINNFKNEQGDLVLGDIINSIDKKIEFPISSYFIADVNNANGADCKLIEQLFKEDTGNFFGFTGYNTSANTLGCAILCAIVKLRAIKNNSYSDIAFKKFQFIRLLDDWIYQAIYRKYIRENAGDFENALKEKENEINLKSKEISDFLNLKPKKITYSLPWKRSFEVRIKLSLQKN